MYDHMENLHHMDNSSYSNGSFNNFSYVTNEEGNTSEDHYTSYNTPPPPHPPQPPAPPSYPFHLESVSSRSMNLYRSEQNFHLLHNQPRNGGFLPGRDIVPNMPGSYHSMMYPPNSPWQTFEPGLDMRGLSLPSLPRPTKQKRPRMSLQKRLLVNARERERMRVLNKAFESLRDALPCYIADGHMAKITTLRLAINYIKALTDLLSEQKAVGNKYGLGHRKEQNHEELFSNIFKDSRTDGIKPVLKNLDERLAISKKQRRETDKF